MSPPAPSDGSGPDGAGDEPQQDRLIHLAQAVEPLLDALDRLDAELGHPEHLRSLLARARLSLRLALE